MALHPRRLTSADDEDLAGVAAPQARLDEAEDYLHQLSTNLNHMDDDERRHQARVRAARAEVRRLQRSAAKMKSVPPASVARVRAPRARARRSAQSHGGSRAASSGSSDSDGSGDPDSDPPPSPSAPPATPSLPAKQSLPHDRLWSVEDLARFLGIATQTVYTAIHRRQYPEKIPAPSLRVMSRARWRPEDVHAWVAERCGSHVEPVREPVPLAPGKRGRGRPRLSDRRETVGGAK